MLNRIATGLIGSSLLILGVTSCGASTEGGYEDETSNSDSAPVEREFHDYVVVNVEMSDGRTVDCVILYTGSANAECDFENAR